jgi:hypothetical protein
MSSGDEPTGNPTVLAPAHLADSLGQLQAELVAVSRELDAVRTGAAAKVLELETQLKQLSGAASILENTISLAVTEPVAPERAADDQSVKPEPVGADKLDVYKDIPEPIPSETVQEFAAVEQQGAVPAEMAAVEPTTAEADALADAMLGDISREASNAVADAMLGDISRGTADLAAVQESSPLAPVVRRPPASVYVASAQPSFPDPSTSPDVPALPDPVDGVLEEEFGIYIQAQATPPPVPAFDESASSPHQPVVPADDFGEVVRAPDRSSAPEGAAMDTREAAATIFEPFDTPFAAAIATVEAIQDELIAPESDAMPPPAAPLRDEWA